MATDPNKTVFISYRRSTSQELARSIFMHLKYNGYDAFFDVNTMDNGAFDDIILNQIGARTHFISIISKGAFERCVNDGDWVRREIEEAMRLGRNVVPILWEGCDFTHETNFLPDHIRDDFRRLSGLPLTHFYFDSGMDILTTRFLKSPTHPVTLKTVSTQEQREIEQRKVQIETAPPPKPTRKSLELMPKPFAWVDIPAGKVTIEAGGYLDKATTFDVGAFQMSKYPITNAQYRLFVDACGYTEKRWWTEDGWQAKLDGWDWVHSFWEKTGKAWIQPRYWDNQDLNGVNHPVVGVSWYEAIAFCQWMSTQTGENITLPTEQQWQWVAQGSDGRKYPWGNIFDSNRCNTIESGIGKTTPVAQYEGKGDSPFGVVDMSGNVWKWCLTEYETGDVGLIGNEERIMRGGSFLGDSDSILLRYWTDPMVTETGFYIVCN
ncbi:MAG: SUMF1/EgtB/PvdO family nonheme iron enzyme [bacterium]|nr:SUMF1/EgtB/PvdO family nonheme iron enzyme [bacterium]